MGRGDRGAAHPDGGLDGTGPGDQDKGALAGGGRWQEGPGALPGGLPVAEGLADGLEGALDLEVAAQHKDGLVRLKPGGVEGTQSLGRGSAHRLGRDRGEAIRVGPE